ncbi:MAG: kelch repeat-containing protein [Blastocatellia bacterium]
MRWIAVCALLAAMAAGLAQFNSRRVQAEQAPALYGEAAVRQLKTDGGYGSLAAAMAAARNQLNVAPARSAAPFYANNPLTIDPILTQQQKLTAVDAAALAPEPAGRVSAAAVGPSWSLTGSLNTPRSYHTATLLANGKVLVAGGIPRRIGPVSATNSAELYDPATGT